MWGEEEGTDLFLSCLTSFVSDWPARRSAKHSRASQLFNFEDESVRASELIALDGGANEFDLVLRNATRDKLTVSLLTLLSGRCEGKKARVGI